MKRVIYLFGILYSLFSYSQEDDSYKEALSNSLYTQTDLFHSQNISSPDVAAFQKVHMVPVSHYTGRIDLAIPFYEINVGNIKIPISLSYNSSGVKVNDMASNVGLNWSLNAGGVISKIIKGIDDFKRPELPGASATSEDYSMMGTLSFVNYPKASNRSFTKYNDPEADIFAVSAPGLTTSYIHQPIRYNGKPSQHLPRTIELEPKGSIIKEHMATMTDDTEQNFEKIEVTSINGIRYTFSDNETFVSWGPAKVWKTHRVRKISQSGNTIELFVYPKVSAYMLNSIYDLSTNQKVDFEYESYSINKIVDDIYQPVMIYGNSVPTNRFKDFLGIYSKTYYPLRQRLTKINFQGGSVEFQYDLTREDNSYEKALTDIIIKDDTGIIIKKFKLEYSYFISNIKSNTAQGKRLRLDRVYELDKDNNALPAYTFDYNEAYQMPSRDSYAHDFLGYNNGSYNDNVSITGAVPKMYFTYSKGLSSASANLSPFYSASAQELPSGNFSLESNEDYAKTYTLEKVTFPTGGFNEYEYELNEFNYKSQTIKGGGLRIKTQILDNGKGNRQIMDYEYQSGSIGRFPSFVMMGGNLPESGKNIQEVLNSVWMQTYSVPNSQVELTQGSFVTYNEVKEEYRTGAKGYKKMFYSNWEWGSLYDNLRASITNSDYDAHISHLAMNNSSLTVDRSFLRGKLTHEYYFDSNNKVRLAKEYKYTLNNFENIELGRVNIGFPKFPENCFNPSGSYSYTNERCPGYLEEVTIPIDRHLLTEVITKDYEKGLVNIEDTDERIITSKAHTLQTSIRYTYDNQLPLVINERKNIKQYSVGNNQVELTGDHVDLLGLTNEQIVVLQREVSTRETLTLLEAIDILGLSKSDLPNGILQILNIATPLNSTITSKETIYPITNGVESSLPMVDELISQNRLSTPLKILSKSNDRLVVIGEEHHYKQFGNILDVEKVNLLDTNSSITESDKIIRRDVNGRILEYQRRDGVYITMLYGYGGLYKIADIENCRYDDLMNIIEGAEIRLHRDHMDLLGLDATLREYLQQVDSNHAPPGLQGAEYLSLANALLALEQYHDFDLTQLPQEILQILNITSPSELIDDEIHLRSISKEDIGFMNSLRDYFRVRNIDAKVTSYTHIPMVGVTSITDPRGQTIYYEYDSHNRLEYVKDDEKNVIKKYTYHYKEKD